MRSSATRRCADDGAREGPKKPDVEVLAITDENGQPVRAVAETMTDNG